MEYIDQGYVVTCIPKRPWPTNKTTAMPIRLRNKLNNDCAVTPTAWATDRADMHVIHRPTDRADMPMIPITVVPISLRPEHD